MKRLILLAVVLSVGISLAGWRGRFDEQFAAALNAGTPIPAVAWYKLDGNALDSSGNGYDGTWSGTEAYSDGGAVFSPTNRIDVSSFNSGTDALTVSVRVKLGPDIASIAPAFVRRDNIFSLDRGSLNTTKTRFYVFGPNVAAILSTGISTGQWVHVAGTYDRVSIKIYVDGVLSASQSATAAIAVLNRTMWLGFGNAQYLDGTLDDVRIYNRALSEANIARIMTGQDVAPIEELQ